MAFLDTLVPVTTSQKQSRAEAVAKQVEEAIIRDNLPPTSPLGTKDEIQQRLNVARGTLNEAIRLLRARDIIDMRPGPNGGIFVSETPPLVRFGSAVLKLKHSPTLVEECFMVKDALDPWVAREAARHRNTADIKDLRRIVAEMESDVDTGMKQRMALNWKLHRRIAKVSKSMVLQSIYTSLLDIAQNELLEVLAGSEPDLQHHLDRNEVHRNLVEAIAAGDENLAFTLGGDAHRFPVHKLRAQT
jgi:DNA-binding FadR family transcriptional regulator